VKHLFRFIFTGALLLASLIIFNDQKNENLAQQSDQWDIEHVDSEAEICSIRTSSTSGLSGWRNSVTINVPISDHFKDTEYLHRIRNQMRIHRELLPELNDRSGHYLQRHPSFEDPLIA